MPELGDTRLLCTLSFKTSLPLFALSRGKIGIESREFQGDRISVGNKYHPFHIIAIRKLGLQGE
jgi:hypothetical protein